MKTYTEKQTNEIYEWLDLLFSDVFPQGRGMLYDDGNDIGGDPEGFCCLGVAVFGNLVVPYDSCTTFHFSGFDDDDLEAFMNMNDNLNMSFEEIGYVILLSLVSGESVSSIYDSKYDNEEND